MVLHQSANLDWNLSCAYDPGYIHQDLRIERSEKEDVYTQLSGAPSILEAWAPSLWPGGMGGILGGRGVRSGVGSLNWSAGGVAVHWCLQCVWGFSAVPCWHRRQPSFWFSRSIAGYLTIAAFTFSCPGNPTPGIICSCTSAEDFLIKSCVSSIALCENPPLTILAIFKARRLSDFSRCTRPPCLAIVVEMLKTYQKLVAASTDEIWLLPLPYIFV